MATIGQRASASRLGPSARGMERPPTDRPPDRSSVSRPLPVPVPPAASPADGSEGWQALIPPTPVLIAAGVALFPILAVGLFPSVSASAAALMMTVSGLGLGVVGWHFGQSLTARRARQDQRRMGELVSRRLLRLQATADRVRLLASEGQNRMETGQQPITFDFFAGLERQAATLQDELADAAADWRGVVNAEDVAAALAEASTRLAEAASRAVPPPPPQPMGYALEGSLEVALERSGSRAVIEPPSLDRLDAAASGSRSAVGSGSQGLDASGSQIVQRDGGLNRPLARPQPRPRPKE